MFAIIYAAFIKQLLHSFMYKDSSTKHDTCNMSIIC